MPSKFVLVLLATQPWAVVLLVSWIYSILDTDEWVFSPSSLFVESNISPIEILLRIVAQHNEILYALLRQPIVWSDDLKQNHLMHCLIREHGLLEPSSLSEKNFLIYERILCLWRTVGFKLLLINSILHFLCISNLLYHFHRANQSLVDKFCVEDFWLPVALGISAVAYETLAVCNYSNEPVQIGEILCVFCSL